MLILQASIKNIPGTNRVGIVLSVALAVLVTLSATGQIVHALADPQFDKTKAAAEKGDAAAQCTVARSYAVGAEPEKALLWYRKSAQQGNTNAQWELAEMLMYRAGRITTAKERSVADVEEAIKWYVAAANLGHKRSPIELGRIYSSGRFVPKDPPEAYKWYSIAMADPAWAGRAVHVERESLIRSMTQQQIEEGKRRAEKYLPTQPGAAQSTSETGKSPLEKVTLGGILVTKARKLAIVNGQTVAAGESASVAIDGKNYKVRCLSVGDGTATVGIDGVPGTKELRVKPAGTARSVQHQAN